MARVLKHSLTSQPLSGSQAARDCGEMIDLAIKGRARELVQDLGYPRSEAEAILVGALARYLDERFSVSNREALGMLT